MSHTIQLGQDRQLGPVSVRQRLSRQTTTNPPDPSVPITWPRLPFFGFSVMSPPLTRVSPTPPYN